MKGLVVWSGCVRGERRFKLDGNTYLRRGVAGKVDRSFEGHVVGKVIFRVPSDRPTSCAPRTMLLVRPGNSFICMPRTCECCVRHVLSALSSLINTHLFKL